MRSIILFSLLICTVFAAECSKGKTGCSSGKCCSYWGYCGTDTNYCGSGTYQCVCDCAAKGSCVATAAACQNRYVARTTAIRKTASTTGVFVSNVYRGDVVCFTEKLASGWVKLNTGNYVYAGDLMVSNPLANVSCQIRYAARTTYVRLTASTSGTIAKTLNKGDSICFTEKLASGWVKLNNDLYVYAGDLMVSNPNALNLNISKRLITIKQGNWVRTPDVIVCHIAEGYYEGTISTLINPKVEASCHFVVGRNGEIAQLLPLEKSSWCQGITNAQTKSATAKIVKERGINPNGYSISIEHQGFWSECKGCLYEAQKQATGKLIKHIQNEVKRIYGYTIPLDRDHIIGHSEIYPKGKPYCPGANFPWTDVINIAKSFA